MKIVTKTNNNKMIHNHNYQITRKIRIIGGIWRGKKIIVTQNPELRPTTNQIRETLFNWLKTTIKGSNCLDCFAGSGALGLEALSRYAHNVTFLEKNQNTSNKIKKIIQYLHIQQQTKIITTDSNKWLTCPRHNIKPYDIVFLDPPFSKWHYIKNIIKLLEKNQYLANNAWIYIEHKRTNNIATSIIPNTWKLHKQKNTGNISYQIYIKTLK